MKAKDIIVGHEYSRDGKRRKVIGFYGNRALYEKPWNYNTFYCSMKTFLKFAQSEVKE
jgi:hypothetical protein